MSFEHQLAEEAAKKQVKSDDSGENVDKVDDSQFEFLTFSDLGKGREEGQDDDSNTMEQQKEDVSLDWGRENMSQPMFMGKTRSIFSYFGLSWLFEIDEDDEVEDELSPLLEELDINVGEIATKYRTVLFPHGLDDETKINHFLDLWGPLFVMLCLCFLSLWGNMGAFGWVFTLWITGSVGLYLLTRVLEGQNSYSQVFSVTGYGALPLVVVAALFAVFSPSIAIIRLFLQAGGLGWSTFITTRLLVTEDIAKKQWMLAFPVFLFHSFLLILV